MRRTASLAQRAGVGVRMLWSILRDIVRGATGADAYERYLAHARQAHPERTPLTPAAYFREEQVARWEGLRRCC